MSYRKPTLLNNKTIWDYLIAPALILSLLLLGFPPFSAQASSRVFSPAELAAIQLEEMTPEERVGQLFLVTFNGTDTSPASPIYDYIANYHIGGIVLDRDNDNFQNPDQIPSDCWNLVQSLQIIEHDTSTLGSGNENSDDNSSVYVPLFVSISQEGDYSPYSEIITGLSPIPSQMSLGATWDPDLAEQIGSQVGRELSSLGINLLFGPSLDVVSNTSPAQSDLGVRSFGGDPFWVGKFGQAYIRGIHRGSLNNIAVVAKYFPGLGSSDRLPEEEVATVRTSLEQLKQIDLAPFFAVTGNAPNSDSTADALLNSHIRYQGLQGNIRSTTRPISLDPQALDLLMSLEPFNNWREADGVIVSDNLGSQALQNLYDPTGESYNILRVAVDAFIAGNDLLFLGNFGDVNKPIPNHEIIATINFFSRKYKEDQDFADRVDRSVLRILTLKYSIYASFNLSTVLTSEDTLSAIGNSDTAEIVARQSATLINPDITELASVLQPPPSYQDRIVILSDSEVASVCSGCPEFATFDTYALENAIIRLYGPYSGGQLLRANIISYSFKDLTTLLDFPDETEQMVTDIYNANWLVVASLDQNENRPYSLALSRLLSERQDLLRNKRIIVFALGAPYYLDATNISKISAFIALYNHFPPSLDVAARILLNEFPAFPGSLPVSVPGINYDLITATSPDPTVPFTVYVGQTADENISTQTPDATQAVPVFHLEDQIVLTTSIILDHNGNPVPDGTPVTFYVSSEGTTRALPQVTTSAGSAITSFFVESGSDLSVYAESSGALSQTIKISILGDGSLSSTQTDIPAQITQSPQPTTDVEAGILDNEAKSPTNTPSLWIIWIVSITLTMLVALAAYQAGAGSGLVRWGIRWSLASVIAGLAVYNFVLLGLPGADRLFPKGITLLGLGTAVLIGALVGWLVAYLYQRLFES